MSSSFQSTAFNSSASPVDTFVAPPSVQPKTGVEELASALANVNPTLQKMLGLKLNQEKENEIARGMQIKMEEGKKELPKVINEIKNREGKEKAKQLVGGNIFTQYGYEKQSAVLLAENTNRKIQNLYNNYTIAKVINGETVRIPISNFDVTSPEYEGFQQEALNMNTENLKDIRPTLIADIYTPNVNKTLMSVGETHLKENSEFKIARNNNQLRETILTTWTSFDEGKITKEDAQETIQNFIEESYSLGMTDNVSGENMLKIVKDQAARIFNINRENNQGGYAEASKYLDLVKDLKYGPKELQKDGSYKQRKVGDLYGEDMLNFEIGLIKKENELKKFQKENYDEKQKEKIRKKLYDNPNNIDLAEEILENNLEYREFIFDTIEIVATDRDELFNDFDRKVATQFYANNRDQMFTDLEFIKKQIGITMTPEDEDRYKLSWERANASTSKRVNYDTKIQRTHMEGIKLITKIDGNGQPEWFQDTVNKREPYLKIKTFYDRRFLDEVYVPGLEGKDREEKFREIQNEYYADLLELSGAKGEDLNRIKKDFGNILDVEPKTEKEKGIQDLVDSYGLSFENAEKIYNEEFIETVIEPSSKTEGKKEEENKNKDDKPETNFFELLRKGFSKENVEGGAFTEGGFTTVDISSGDTLSGIANDLDTSVEAIKKANGLTTDQIQIGDVLIIPEGITDPNKVNAPEFDINKLITEKDHPFNPVREKHNFQVIYNIAKEIGIKYPELVAAQAMEETGFGKTQSAENNFLGLQATPSEVARGKSERKLTTEFRGQGEQVEEADFKTFDNIKAMMMQYKKQWNDNFTTKSYSRKGIVNANSIQEAIKMLQAEDYATNPNYDKNVLRIIDRAIKEGWF